MIIGKPILEPLLSFDSFKFIISIIQVLQKEGEKNLSMLENEIVKRREESNADVAHYQKVKQAEANSQLYTQQYVQLEMAKSLSKNTKFFFSGENSVLGALLKNVMGNDKE